FIRSMKRDSTGNETICERGTMTSPTVMSDTAMAPSIMRRVSASTRPSAWASRSSSMRSSRVVGSPEIAELRRSSQPRRRSGGSGPARLLPWLLLSASDLSLVSSPWGKGGPAVYRVRSGHAVGIVDAQPGQDFTLQLLHGLGLDVVAVVPAQ